MIDIDTETEKEELKKLEQLQKKHRMQLEQNRQKLLQRKAHTRTLIQHGKLLEAYYPETTDMSLNDFELWLSILNH